MRIPTLAALCCVAALSWACNLENPLGREEEPPALEEPTLGDREQDATERGREGPRRGEYGMGKMDCPMDVTGTTVALSEWDGSIVMTFSTPSGDVEELRDRVRAMAERWERRAMRRERREGEVDEDRERMPRASTAVELVDGGARLVMVPEDPADLDRLRQRVREKQERMSSTGKCAFDDDQGEG